MKIAVFHNLPLGGARRTLYEQIKNLSKRHTIDLYEIGYENHLLEANEFVKFRKKYDFTLENNIPGIFNRLIKDYRNFISLRNLQRKIAGEIDTEISKILTEAQKKAIDNLTKHKSLLRKIADKLIKEETIEGPEFDKLFK